MNMLPPFASPGGTAAGDVLAWQWRALHDAATVIAQLAGEECGPMLPAIAAFPATIAEAGEWRLIMAEQGIADLAAVLASGITALLAVRARGVNPSIAAKALWREFVLARDGLLALAPPPQAAEADRAD